MRPGKTLKPGQRWVKPVELRAFLVPALDAAANARDFERSWVNGSPWAAKHAFLDPSEDKLIMPKEGGWWVSDNRFLTDIAKMLRLDYMNSR